MVVMVVMVPLCVATVIIMINVTLALPINLRCHWCRCCVYRYYPYHYSYYEYCYNHYYYFNYHYQ